jgi:acetyl/propionyl-CoA carboxylase alpha subunit
MIRKILIASRGVSALRVLSTCRRLGIKSVAVYSDADKESPHAHLADEAVALGPADSPPAPGLLEAARRTGADAVHPGCGALAADADFAAACEAAGLIFIGPPSNQLRFGASKPEAQAKEKVRPFACASGFDEAARSLGIAVASDRGDPDARLIEFQVFGDQHGNAIHLFDRDSSIHRDGRKVLFETPAPTLDGDLRARMAETAVKLAQEIGYQSAATIRFLLTPGGDFLYFEGEPFLSAEHPVTEAATGLDLVQLQIEIAEGRRLPIEAPRACGHAIGASLHASNAPGAPSVTRTLHVWEPPPATGDLRIDAGVAQGMQVSPNDPLLAQFIATDGVRDGAIRKLSQALEALWTGGVPTNQEMLLHVLKSQEFLDGKVQLGFLDQHPVQIVADEASDIVFAAACVLYFEGSRHAQRAFLPGVPPNYRNNPYRDPSMALRIGTRDLAMSWRRVGGNRHRIHSGKTELDGEVLALRPGTMSVVLDGILREFRFREVAEEVYVHSSLGSRVIQRLSRYSRPETAPSALPQTVPAPSKSVASAPRTPTARWPSKPRRPASS